MDRQNNEQRIGRRNRLTDDFGKMYVEAESSAIERVGIAR